MSFSLLMFAMDTNSVLLYSKLLAFAFLLQMFFFFCLLLVLHVQIVPPLDVRQLEILCVKMLTYFVNIWLCLSTFKVTLFMLVAFVHELILV
jgi:hypothetical protein